MSPTRAQVGAEHYGDTYDSKERFSSYWHQISEALRLNPASLLEIGIGSGFTSGYLRRRGVEVTTLDIHGSLRPLVVGDAGALPFADGAFDAVLCCEVLEHLPFEAVLNAASELARVSRRGAVVSVPDASPCFRIHAGVPDLAEFRAFFPLPGRRPRHRFDGEHYWEIGKKGYSLAKVERVLRQAGFDVESTYRVFEMPYHRFFRLVPIEETSVPR